MDFGKICMAFMLLMAGLKAEEACSNEDGKCESSEKPHARCDQKTDAGEMGECYGQLYKTGKIGDLEYQNGLFLAMTKLASPSSYYSVGIEYGHKNTFTMGSQTHYQFATRYTLDLKIPY